MADDEREAGSEEQIIGVMNVAETGLAEEELLRKQGIAEGTFFRWKAKYGGMELSVEPDCFVAA